MSDFNESTKRLYLIAPGMTPRAADDRRASTAAAPVSGTAPKRRRHDNLNAARQAPLVW